MSITIKEDLFAPCLEFLTAQGVNGQDWQLRQLEQDWLILDLVDAQLAEKFFAEFPQHRS